ncbi:MAG: glycosyltransferase family 4 protein [Candidatus Dormibacteraeota bacterium]|nr:glycosyltransferase family 4 protein [Candidatus Dormibacteraeota bacterium]
MSRRTVTFITHEATRTGAPRVLLSLMQWLRANSDLLMQTLAVNPGPLLPEFASLGRVVEMEGDWSHLLFLQRGMRLARQMTVGRLDRPFDALVHRAAAQGLWLANARNLQRLGECDLIYANSVQSGWGVRSINSRAPLLSHLHELEDALLDPYEAPNVRTMCGARARQIIVPAVAVRDLLVTRMGIEASRVNVLYPFITVPDKPVNRETRAAVRRALEIPEEAVVVGMSGAFILRKSPDRFIDIAARVVRHARGAPVYFVWIGGDAKLEYGRYMVTDVRRLGLTERFRHVTERIDPSPYLGALDIFLLSSRSDPFPLVCLEAAVHAEAPIVCFDQAGGMPELVGHDCGIVVPYLDTVAGADAVLRLVDDAAERRRLGANAAERVRSNHNVTRSAPAIAAMMAQVIERAAAARLQASAGRSYASIQPAPAVNGAAPPAGLQSDEERREPHGAGALVHAK